MTMLPFLLLVAIDAQPDMVLFSQARANMATVLVNQPSYVMPGDHRPKREVEVWIEGLVMRKVCGLGLTRDTEGLSLGTIYMRGMRRKLLAGDRAGWVTTALPQVPKEERN